MITGPRRQRPGKGCQLVEQPSHGRCEGYRKLVNHTSNERFMLEVIRRSGASQRLLSARSRIWCFSRAVIQRKRFQQPRGGHQPVAV